MEIKISKKPVKYEEAIEYLDERVHQLSCLLYTSDAADDS